MPHGHYDPRNPPKPKRRMDLPPKAGKAKGGKGPMLHEGLRVTGQRRGTRKR